MRQVVWLQGSITRMHGQQNKNLLMLFVPAHYFTRNTQIQLAALWQHYVFRTAQYAKMLLLAAAACLACAVANCAVADRQTDRVQSSDEKTYIKYKRIIQETYTNMRKKVKTT